jgi:hypothetical protein
LAAASVPPYGGPSRLPHSGTGADAARFLFFHIGSPDAPAKNQQALDPSEPKSGDPWTIEIPRAIKNPLKLDDSRSWIDVTEFNVFSWAGCPPAADETSLGKPKPSQETCLYGYLPNAFLER